MKLIGKVVIITGSSSGIGRATALKFAQEEARIVVNYKSNADGARDVAKEIEILGGKVVCVQADVSDSQQVKKMFTRAVKEFGTVDILINNAGLAKAKPFFEITKEDLETEFGKNFFSMVYCAQEAVRLMQKNGGRIINMSSICGGVDSSPCTSILTFTTAKAAVSMLTKVLAKTLAPKILVNAVAPGFTLTRFWEGMSKKDEGALLETTLTKSWVTADEIANAFIYLAKSDSITGQVLVVDGGYTINNR